MHEDRDGSTVGSQVTPEIPDQVPTPAGGRRRALLLWSMAVVAAAAILAVLVNNWHQVASFDWDLSPAWLVAGVLLSLVAFQVNGMTYCRSVAMISTAVPPPAAGMSLWARSLLARYIPGSVMLVVGRAVMAGEWGVAKRATVTATIYEQFIGLGLGLASTAAYLALYGNPGDRRLMWVLVIIPICVVGLHPRIFGPLTARLLRMVGRPPLDHYYTGRQILRLLAGYTLGAVFTCLGVWALLRSATGPQIGGPLEVSLAFLLAFAVSTAAFIFPSGLGLRDGLLAVLFARHLAAGPALALAVGLRFALVLIELLYVGLATLRGRRA